MVAEQHLTAKDFIWPVFVHGGPEPEVPVPSMPGVVRYSLDAVVDAVGHAVELGIPAIAIFPATDPSKKTPLAEEALNPDNLVCQALRSLKQAFGNDVGLLADVALDPYSSHGQDGLVRNGYVANDETLDVLCRQAVVQAEAGCDIAAPSDMMDGRIGAIRAALDAEGRDDVMIMAYAAKYASAFYGPFREAVDSSLTGDRRTYQQDARNALEGVRETLLDIEQGADIVMVKPGLAYLDVLRRVADAAADFGVPVAAYNISGEYSMVEAAAANGWIDREPAILETLTAFRRAGADMVLTYWATEAAGLLR